MHLVKYVDKSTCKILKYMKGSVNMLSRFEQFTYVISGINRYIQKLERDEMVKCGYKGSFAQYLAAMNHYEEGITSAQLCEICDRDKAAVSRVVAEMEGCGLIQRVGAKENKYRARLYLTEKGKEVAAFVAERARTAVKAVGEELTDRERAILYATLDQIASKLQTLTKEGIPEQEVEAR